MANNVINLETTLLEKKYIATKKRYELLKHFQENDKKLLPSDSLSETHFFLCVSERESIVFAEFDYKKNGTHIFVHPIGFLKQEGYFFQVTDLQFLETLLSE